MFGWFFKKGIKELEEKTKNGFLTVKKDIEASAKWIKHLDQRDKQLFDIINEMEREISTIKDEIASLRESVGLVIESEKNKQVFKKIGVLTKQTPVYGVEKVVQTAVQTDNFYEILKSLSASERLIIFTLANSDMKLSYEDLALLLGKEKATIRGQINSIKQKSESLIEEIVEKNGKKRLFITEDAKRKFQKYAKVRVKKREKQE